ncbi:unnamed protein product [Schistocephalus solidus]|uniref:Trafficking protein particle complex subunit n=1 Tax=Schistocephalus solidus TaxID=70667 RepID=A0A183TEQ1_SCHSO|nr:unnamed protein product [Schistocephalus solidus]
MKLFNLYLFNVHGCNIFYREWISLKTDESQENQGKLVHGMLVGLKALCSKLSPTENEIHSLTYHTSKYRLHYLESPTGLKIVLNTDHCTPSLIKELETVYKLYVEHVIKAPDFDPNELNRIRNQFIRPMFLQGFCGDVYL